MCIHVTFVTQLPCDDGHITGHGHAGAVYNKQILSSRTVQWQAVCLPWWWLCLQIR